MATQNPALESPSGEGTRNVPRSDSSLDNDPNYLDTSLNFFYINFCNIRSLRPNFQSVERGTTSPLLNLIFSSPKHSCLRQLTVAPLFPPTFSILIFVPKLDVASM
ncbi:hypothetical protein E2C01_026464 [Portunus trituberculatus]|uniref:Uncharacterized protein n=1 Tax=Portunus trituberculatus TaxID=210409 RepID=A0A5B7EFP8_PORTR|nr:hypothetical protein [Portunus trituberculatus]